MPQLRVHHGVQLTVIAVEDVVGFDPYDILDSEAHRIDTHLSSIPADDPTWALGSRCVGWTRRDVLAHLVRTEEYHAACLDDALDAFIARGVSLGARSVDEFNEVGLRELDGWGPVALLEEWRRRDADTRRRLRQRDGTDMATSVGPYPVRSQAFHIASELATHADDMSVPVAPGEAGDRLAWRVAFSRAAVVEARPSIRLDVVAGGTRVRTGRTGTGRIDVVVDDVAFVEAVAGRDLGDHELGERLGTALSLMP